MTMSQFKKLLDTFAADEAREARARLSRPLCPECGLEACDCELPPQPPLRPYESEDFG